MTVHLVIGFLAAWLSIGLAVLIAYVAYRIFLARVKIVKAPVTVYRPTRTTHVAAKSSTSDRQTGPISDEIWDSDDITKELGDSRLDDDLIG